MYFYALGSPRSSVVLTVPATRAVCPELYPPRVIFARHTPHAFVRIVSTCFPRVLFARSARVTLRCFPALCTVLVVPARYRAFCVPSALFRSYAFSCSLRLEQVCAPPVLSTSCQCALSTPALDFSCPRVFFASTKRLRAQCRCCQLRAHYALTTRSSSSLRSPWSRHTKHVLTLIAFAFPCFRVLVLPTASLTPSVRRENFAKSKLKARNGCLHSKMCFRSKDFATEGKCDWSCI